MPQGAFTSCVTHSEARPAGSQGSRAHLQLSLDRPHPAGPLRQARGLPFPHGPGHRAAQRGERPGCSVPGLLPSAAAEGLGRHRGATAGARHWGAQPERGPGPALSAWRGRQWWPARLKQGKRGRKSLQSPVGSSWQVLCPAAAAPTPPRRGLRISVSLGLLGSAVRRQASASSSVERGPHSTAHSWLGLRLGVRGGATPAHQGSPPRPSAPPSALTVAAPGPSGNSSLTTTSQALPMQKAGRDRPAA